MDRAPGRERSARPGAVDRSAGNFLSQIWGRAGSFRRSSRRGADLHGSIPGRSQHSSADASASLQAPLLGAHGPAPQPRRGTPFVARRAMNPRTAALYLTAPPSCGCYAGNRDPLDAGLTPTPSFGWERPVVCRIPGKLL